MSPKYLLAGDFLGPNGTVQKISPELPGKFQNNQIVSAHKEVYTSFKSDELPAAVDKTFKEKPPLVPELPPDLLLEMTGWRGASRSAPMPRPAS